MYPSRFLLRWLTMRSITKMAVSTRMVPSDTGMLSSALSEASPCSSMPTFTSSPTRLQVWTSVLTLTTRSTANMVIVDGMTATCSTAATSRKKCHTTVSLTSHHLICPSLSFGHRPPCSCDTYPHKERYFDHQGNPRWALLCGSNCPCSRCDHQWHQGPRRLERSGLFQELLRQSIPR
jgi:hypothetical protein